MRPVQFDSFGEPIAQPLCDEPVASRIALRTGVGLFWALVVVIVAARAAYFHPDLAERFGSVATVIDQLRAVVGA
ncbi:hypothetical protein [Methylobacterium sp. R2-1]|uniref:hypothetical protein n=1 Tax=Methylobacterium sp. R2-1 TaxID=2587064 RepID=UPI00161F1B04|nr:hypothetical protein [Methylobacterium sp. R2-1]MBB2961359.1 hypothetical protein [Methylobacterium sp. R2-1]